ncbi:MAG: hypothetical protein KF683_01505 [Rubrivivax sp.]|nr:hypothetical protein [Rubrivivax sp.]
MTRLALPQVTLVAIDTRSPALAAQALQRSMAGVDFARALLFTQGWQTPGTSPALAGITLADCGPIASGADYSHFVLRRLPAFVDTPHVLVTQWDGFVVDPSAWRPEFLDFDYVGAVWADAPLKGLVGNGGFSLRSQRLLRAGLDARIVDEHPEDLRLCSSYRALLERDHGVRFAPPALARRFAFENEAPDGPTFGFHGPCNLPRFLDAATLQQWLDALPDAFFRSRDARRLARALIGRGMAPVAAQLLARRRAAGMGDLKTRSLGWAAQALSRFSSPGR